MLKLSWTKGWLVIASLVGCTSAAEDLEGLSATGPDDNIPPVDDRFSCHGEARFAVVSDVDQILMGTEAVALSSQWVATYARVRGRPSLSRFFGADLSNRLDIVPQLPAQAWFGQPHLASSGSGFVDAVLESDGPDGREVVRYHRLDQLATPQSRLPVDDDVRVWDVGDAPNNTPVYVASRGLGTTDAQLVVGQQSSAWIRDIPSEQIQTVRIHPRPSVVTFMQQGRVNVVPYTPAGGGFPAWPVTPCFTGVPQAYAFTGTDDEGITVAMCAGELAVERHDVRTGQRLARRTIALQGARSVRLAATLDSANSLVVAVWPDFADAPRLHLIDGRDLTDLRPPVTIPWSRGFSAVSGALTLAASPTRPAVIGLGFSTVVGHGAGDLHLARVELCTR